jgi:hypothetical protein
MERSNKMQRCLGRLLIGVAMLGMSAGIAGAGETGH